MIGESRLQHRADSLSVSPYFALAISNDQRRRNHLGDSSNYCKNQPWSYQIEFQLVVFKNTDAAVLVGICLSIELIFISVFNITEKFQLRQ